LGQVQPTRGATEVKFLGEGQQQSQLMSGRIVDAGQTELGLINNRHIIKLHRF
jgi:hypothetical protein